MSEHKTGMNCPTCNVTLVMTERKGIEIDYCPTCRGVWLDRGELDKIIERSSEGEAPRQAAPEPARAPQPRYSDHDRDDDYKRSSSYGYPKKRKSWLEEIFD